MAKYKPELGFRFGLNFSFKVGMLSVTISGFEIRHWINPYYY